MQARIAVIEQNTLSAIGLAGLIEELMPMGEVSLYNSLEALAAQSKVSHNATDDPFVHYFISAQTLLNHARFFLPRRHKTIVLVQGSEAASLPEGFKQINTSQTREGLLRSLMMLHSHAHGPKGIRPYPASGASGQAHSQMQGKARHEAKEKPLLTRRETDVLRQLVRGLSNKETAEALGVGLTTVITHRNNLTSKLGTRSLATLTVYAVSHGIVGIEEI